MFRIKMKYLTDKVLRSRKKWMKIWLRFAQYFQQVEVVLLLIIEWRPNGTQAHSWQIVWFFCRSSAKFGTDKSPTEHVITNGVSHLYSEYTRCFLGNEAHYPKVSGRFLLFPQAKIVNVALIRPWPTRTISFPFLYSHTTLTIDEIHYVVTAWLSKSLMQRASKAAVVVTVSS